MYLVQSHRTLRKLVLYLILVNFVLIGAYHWLFDVLDLVGQLTAGCLLVAYNLFLVNLIHQHTHDSSESYIVYPVVISIFALAASLIYQFFNF